jgi:hypothetical protein
MSLELEIKSAIDNVAALSGKVDTAASDARDAKAALAELQAKFEGVTTEAQLQEVKNEMQKQIDEVAALRKAAVPERKQALSFEQAVKETLTPEVLKEVANDFEKHKKATIQLPKEAKLFSIDGSLTGDPINNYAPQPAILPSSPRNFRDIIPVTYSPDGTYVTYRENSGATNNIAKQVEGSAKGENNYTMTEVKTVTEYVAGYTVFTKQALRKLSFMSQTMPRLLTRDFFLKENALGYGYVVSNATGAPSTGATDKVEKVIDYIAGLRDTRFVPSYALVSNAVHAALLKATYGKGYYAGAGSVYIDGNQLMINGTAIVPVDFADADKIMLIDQTFIERVEAEGLKIELSYEDGDNFKKNLVTARVECMEEFNLILPQAHAYLSI